MRYPHRWRNIGLDFFLSGIVATRFSGSAQQAWLVLGVLGTVFTFGATALAYGLWHIRTGQRNRKVVYLIVGLAAVLFLTAALLRRNSKCTSVVC